MAVTSGPRLGLTRWSDPAVDGPSVSQFDGDNASLEDLAALDIQVADLASRPAAAIRGRYCWVVTPGELYRDTGAAWHGPLSTRFTTGSPATASPGGAGAAGTSGAVARSDHRHPTPPWATAVAAIGTTPAVGTADEYARADHRHAIDGGYVRLDTGGDLARAQLVRPQLRNYSEAVQTNAAATGAVTVDLAGGNVAHLTLTGNITLALAGAPPSGQAGTVTLYLRQDATGGRTVTWPGSAQFPGGVRPSLSTTPNSLSVVTLSTIDGGTTWQVFLAGSAIAAAT